jgi:hypothetical protein
VSNVARRNHTFRRAGDKERSFSLLGGRFGDGIRHTKEKDCGTLISRLVATKKRIFGFAHDKLIQWRLDAGPKE